MAIAASGAVSFSDLRTEFVGGSGAISYSDLYRGGSNIRAKAANNNATNLAASVPTSGAINISNFRSQAKGFKYTYASTSTDQDADALFGSDYAVNYPKIIEIPSGVTIGGVSDDALDIPAGLSGSLVINNSGSILGKGGAANGGAGGNAISCAVAGVVFNNFAGAILAGGGGGGGRGGNGGAGGTGGQGSYTTSSTTRQPSSGYYQDNNYGTAGSCGRINWNCSLMGYQSGTTNSATVGGWTYYRAGSSRYNTGCGVCYDESNYGVYREQTTTSTNYTSGGSGGAGGSGGNGGNGAGYNQASSAGASGSGGSSGSAGGTNAGSGGSGGTGGSGGQGGSYGVSGSSGNSGATGNSGANGNYTNGSGGSGGASGSGGGAAGAAVTGTSITINNSGNVYGATA